jgi:hypothetical protein
VRRRLIVLLALMCCLAIAACEPDDDPYHPTPASLPAVLVVLTNAGFSVTNVVSGDAGCSDSTLVSTALSMDLQGFDQTTPTWVYIYGFKDRATFERLDSTVDACAKAYVTNPADYGNVQVSPFVAAGPGPWAASFTDNLRGALTQAAGTGG